MKYRVCWALIASFGAAAVLLTAGDSFAKSGVTPHRLHVAPFAAHHRPGHSWVMWPGGGGFFDEPVVSDAVAAVPPALPSDVRYTYTYDVPWDWAHRFPPNVVPSDRPYVPACPSETVVVPGRGGGEHAVNVMRCY